MKSITEMTLEELQAHALKLTEDVTAGKTREEEQAKKITELTDLNQALQRRNNDLIVKVEKQITGAPEEKKTEEKVVSCEDFAKSLIK